MLCRKIFWGNGLMVEVKNNKEAFENLKATYRTFGQGDLMKFWLFEKHRAIDKWMHYFPVYEKWFSPYRGKDIVFVEVGVQNGGSAQMWKNYFGKDAKIIGIDINPKCKELEEEGISIEIGSQSDEKFWAAFKEKYQNRINEINKLLANKNLPKDRADQLTKEKERIQGIL